MSDQTQGSPPPDPAKPLAKSPSSPHALANGADPATRDAWERAVRAYYKMGYGQHAFAARESGLNVKQVGKWWRGNKHFPHLRPVKAVLDDVAAGRTLDEAMAGPLREPPAPPVDPEVARLAAEAEEGARLRAAAESRRQAEAEESRKMDAQKSRLLRANVLSGAAASSRLGAGLLKAAERLGQQLESGMGTNGAPLDLRPKDLLHLLHQHAASNRALALASESLLALDEARQGGPVSTASMTGIPAGAALDLLEADLERTRRAVERARAYAEGRPPPGMPPDDDGDGLSPSAGNSPNGDEAVH